jgi:hypothetical protein
MALRYAYDTAPGTTTTNPPRILANFLSSTSGFFNGQDGQDLTD